MHRREGSGGVADSLGLYKAREGGGGDRALETGDRRRTSLTYGRTSGDGSRRYRACPQPHAGARTPELCPHRLISNGVGTSASIPLIHAPRWPAPVISRGGYITAEQARQFDLLDTRRLLMLCPCL